MPTYIPKGGNLEAMRAWHVVDARDRTVGRLASRVASLLMGKTKPEFTPFLDVGDHVVVINAAHARFTGKKWEEKVYRHHSGYPGGLKVITAKMMQERHPERILEFAIRGMLPKTKLGRRMGKKLKVYAGPDHPHQAQQPKPLTV